MREGGFELKPEVARRRGSSRSSEPMKHLSALATDAAGQLDVLRHDRDALGVDRAQVGVLEEANQVRLRGLLERDDGRRLEAQVLSLIHI